MSSDTHAPRDDLRDSDAAASVAANLRSERDLARRHVRVAASGFLLVAAMTGLSFAAVPLYQLFCQVTGFGGTTQRADAHDGPVSDRMITVRFDANTAQNLPWRFLPVQHTIDLKLGENRLAFYKAQNTGDEPVTGTATFNVTPEIAGGYFNKIECFCFQEQTLKPGESIDMPVSFFVDPDIVKDIDARDIREITLSYTFFPIEPEKDIAEARSGS